MKLRLTSLIALLLASSFSVISAQGYDDDDIYYNPSKVQKKAKQITTSPSTKQNNTNTRSQQVVNYPSADTFIPSSGSNFDIDAYNRRGVFATDSITHSRSQAAEAQTFENTRKIEKFYNPQVIVESPDNDVAALYYTEPADINITINAPGYWGYSYPYYGYYGPSWYWGSPRWYSSWYYDTWAWGWGPSWNWAWGPSWSWGWGGCYYPPYWGHHHHYYPSWAANRPSGNVRPGYSHSSQSSGNMRPGYHYGSGNSRPVYGGNSSSSYRPGYSAGSNSSYGAGRGTNRSSGSSSSYRSNSSSSRNSSSSSYSRPSSSGNSGSSYRPSSGGSRSSGGSYGGGRSSGGGGGRGRH